MRLENKDYLSLTIMGLKPYPAEICLTISKRNLICVTTNAIYYRILINSKRRRMIGNVKIKSRFKSYEIITSWNLFVFCCEMKFNL